VPAFDHPLVVAGQGTLLAELVSDTPVDCALVAVGGGGLLGGCLAAGGARVIGVETHGTQSMRRALDAGSVVDTELSGLAVDSLGARRVGALPLALAQAHRAEVVLVSDEALRHAQQLLWRELRLAVEPAAAAGLAALVTGAYAPPAGATVGVILCGGNVDPCSLSAPLAGS
jgi:threonine dehydratase